MCVQKACTCIFIAALFLVPPNCKQPKALTAVKQKHQLWPIHTMEYSIAMRMNELLIHPTAWMNLTNTMLSEGRQTFIWSSRTGKTHLWRQLLQQVLPMEWWALLTKELSRRMEVFCILITVLFTCVYPFIKTHQTVYLRSICFTACTFYFNI